MKLSHAINAYLIDKRVSGCSPNTIRNYTLTLARLQEHLPADPELADIAQADLQAFLHQLMTTRIKPRGIADRPARKLSAKTIKNIHTCLCSLWTWAIAEGYATEHIVHPIAIPKPELEPILPFTREQIQALLDACSHSLPWSTSPDTASERPQRRQLRDRAIILFLLDTGVRVSELCNLTLANVDLVGGTAIVQSKGRLNAGQGKKRTIRFQPPTARALRRYLSARGIHDPASRPDQHLFTNRDNYPIERRYLAQHLQRLGQRAGLSDVHPHRFRHTFAIEFLRNKGNLYVLQDLLGHTTLEMVRRYAHIAQTDLEREHRTASPVSNWRL